MLFSDTPRSAGRAPGHLPAVVLAATSPDLLTAAERYLALGFSVIPLRGKMPLVAWSPYQQRRPCQAELQRWAQCGLLHNLGIVCGAVSSGLVVLDFDDMTLYEAFSGRFPGLAQTYTVATGGGGRHVYLRAASLPASRHLPGIELRAHGQQVVAPPSIHPDTGLAYQVRRPLPIRRVADFDPVTAWLMALRPGAGPTITKTTPGASLNPALVVALAALFRERGYRSRGDWLNGPCIYPERHAHGDSRASFGFNTRTGYGYCFVCGSMRARDIAGALKLDPSDYGGVITQNRREVDEQPVT